MGIAEFFKGDRSKAKDISRKNLDGFGPLNKGLAREYLRSPCNPEIITSVWRSLLPGISVPKCMWSEAQIAERVPGINGETYDPLMVPNLREYEGEYGLIRLGRQFSLGKDATVRSDTSVVSYGVGDAFVKIEGSLEAPNLNTSEVDLAAFFARTGRTGITEQVYILGSLFAKLMWNAYFDEVATQSDLQGSHDPKREHTIHAYFEPDGRLSCAVPKHTTDMRQRYLGRRTMELPHPKGA